jgi:hypothetical protein
MEGEAKRRRCRLSEGKEEEAERHPVPCGGGGWRRTAARGATGRAMALGLQEPEVGDEAGGPDRAGLGRADRVATRPKGLFWAKNERKKKMGCRTIFLIFQTKIWF